MAEVAGQPVGNVDRGTGQVAQGEAQRHPWLGSVEPRPGRVVRRQRPVCLPLGDREGRRAELAGYPEVVARLRAVAAQGRAGGHLADHRDADVERPARGVAADQLAVEAVRQREHAPAESLQPGFVGLRQRQRQREGERPRAHRRQVGQVDRQRLVPERLGVDVVEDMPAADQHVGGDRQALAACRRAEQRAIVADPEQGLPGRAPIEEAADQLELAERPGALARRLRELAARRPGELASRLRTHARPPVSTGRSRLATRSSTPFTYL